MIENELHYDCQCESCKGTGLYIGWAERDGFAVVCHSCQGTGRRDIIIKFTPFTGRVKPSNVVRVLQVNPGIIVGCGGHKREEFGGMDFQEWWGGKPFPPGSEMRNFTCPAWWYQSVAYDKKPDWKECISSGLFSLCRYFKAKAQCWERWENDDD